MQTFVSDLRHSENATSSSDNIWLQQLIFRIIASSQNNLNSSFSSRNYLSSKPQFGYQYYMRTIWSKLLILQSVIVTSYVLLGIFDD